MVVVKPTFRHSTASPLQNRLLTKRSKWIKCVFTVHNSAAGEQIVPSAIDLERVIIAANNTTFVLQKKTFCRKPIEKEGKKRTSGARHQQQRKLALYLWRHRCHILRALELLSLPAAFQHIEGTAFDSYVTSLFVLHFLVTGVIH